jgi:hypothetical protein
VISDRFIGDDQNVERIADIRKAKSLAAAIELRVMARQPAPPATPTLFQRLFC